MTVEERIEELKKKRDSLTAQIEGIDRAIASLSDEKMHRYEVDLGESRHEVERPRLSDLVAARKMYAQELKEIEADLEVLTGKKEGRKRKTVVFKFDR